ncbi:MAG: hypothetical protein ABTD50_23660 [Polyangiaceae bacterium]
MSIERDVVTLDGLLRRQLSAVVFVQDYLQLQFDGPLLTLTNWPVVQCAEGEFRYGDTRYRDALCGRIAKTVASAQVRLNDELRLVFVDSSKLLVSLRPEDRGDPEVVRYDENAKHWAVW